MDVWFGVPALFALKWGMKRLLANKTLYAISGAVAVAVRDIACVLLNLYSPSFVFFGMSPNEVIRFFTNPRFQSFISRSLGLIGFTAYFAEVAFCNTV